MKTHLSVGADSSGALLYPRYFVSSNLFPRRSLLPRRFVLRHLFAGSLFNRRSRTCGLSLAALCLACGCAGVNPFAPKPDTASAVPIAGAATGPGPSGLDPQISPDSLARKTAAYAQGMQNAIDTPASAPPTSQQPAAPVSQYAPSAAGAAPSAVNWLDPNEFRLAPLPEQAPSPAQTGQPLVRPAMDVNSASRGPTMVSPDAVSPDGSAMRRARAIARAESAASENLPATIPEALDGAPPAPDGGAGGSNANGATLNGATGNQTTPTGPAGAGTTGASSSAVFANAALQGGFPAPRDGASAFGASGGDASSSDGGSSGILDQKFAQAIRDYPRDIAGQLNWQLLQFVEDRPTPDMAAVSGLPEEDRAILTTLMDGLGNFRETVRSDNNMLLSRKIKPLLDMADRLRSQAELTIPTAALCTKVDGFGMYKAIDPARFSAGVEHPVIIYCEVQNFASQLNDAKLWETRLSQEAVLYTDTGMQIWPDKETPISAVDTCRNRRHDFFMVNIIRLPADLTIGRYLLKVTISDQLANRVAESTVPLEVVAE
jgi:hypothetical protein